MSEHTVEASPGAEDPEDRYRRRVGLALAALAVLGAWIAVLQTNASTNEARTAREATRLASESQRAQVVADGADRGFTEVLTEAVALPERAPLRDAGQIEETFGIAPDPDRQRARVDEARASVESALGEDPGSGVVGSREDARRLSLTQAAVVEERVTWNARASQYETVITTLGVAIFLVGFTLVVGRRSRPPIAAPALLLAVYCLGWAVHIYLKPIPDVDRDAIDAVAVGQVALADGRAADALEAFDRAVEVDDGYAPGWQGRGVATLVAANPDLLNTFAVTDPDRQVVERAAADVERGLEETVDPSAESLTGAALTAIVGGEWELADELLREATEANQLTPAVALARAAVAVALGDGDRAGELLEQIVVEFADLAGTDTARGVVANHLSMLEWIKVAEPERAELAAEQQARVVRLSLAGVDGAAAPESPVEAAVSVTELEFTDGLTRVGIDVTGIPAGVPVAVAGYERPSPDGPWVQPSELYYVGPAPTPSERRPLTIPTPRACAPVEYRFDLWVGDALVDSVTAPGVEPTC